MVNIKNIERECMTNINSVEMIGNKTEMNELTELISWVESLNKTVHVSIEKTTLEKSDFWYYDEIEGEITNHSHSFFQIKGLQQNRDGRKVLEQPIIIQNEIGYLGMICHRFNGVMHFLIQAKIEPGNVNKIQLSPTIQATKSNFMQKHGGKKPAYLEYFLNASKYRILVDQIQSEQSSRFYKKRNRNIIIEVDEKIEVLKSHRWMTLKQIKELMHIDNLVNMDTRTVLSCIPFYNMSDTDFKSFIPNNNEMDIALIKSMRYGKDTNSIFPRIYQYINNFKMFDECETTLIPLYSLESWKMEDGEFVCDKPYNFKIVFCNIEIEGREVRKWSQPLIETLGMATFGLITCVENGVRLFLVRAVAEVGCFDKIELGPTVQKECVSNISMNEIDILFEKYMLDKARVKFDVLLSEEGGRFYCEQNRNVIVEIDNKSEVGTLPEGYFWVDYYTLNELGQVNNCLNIQLRNLLSVLQ